MPYKILLVELVQDVQVNQLLNNLALECVVVKNAQQALLQHAMHNFELTIILSADNDLTLKLAQDIMSIKPAHYIIALANTIHPEQTLAMVKNGICGFIMQPFTQIKLASELQKYAFYQKNMLPVDL